MADFVQSIEQGYQARFESIWELFRESSYSNGTLKHQFSDISQRIQQRCNEVSNQVKKECKELSQKIDEVILGINELNNIL